MESSSSDASPVLPSESAGSSVSAGLQEEYDQLLKYAVVIPDYQTSPLTDQYGRAYRRSPIEKRDNVLSVPAQPLRHRLFLDMEESPCGDSSHSSLAETGGKQSRGFEGNSPGESHARGSSFMPHDSSVPEDRSLRQPAKVRMLFPDADTAQREHMRREVKEEQRVRDVFTPGLDQDVRRVESALDQWCLDLKRNVVAEIAQSKICIEQKSHEELVRQTNQLTLEKDSLKERLEDLKQHLQTFQRSVQRKDVIIGKLTEALGRQRNRSQLLKNLCSWRLQHNDAKREAFSLQVAKLHHQRCLSQRALRAWFSLIHGRWRQRVERCCQKRAEQVCVQLSADYESKVASLNQALHSSREEICQLHAQREKYEEATKKAFMRGVCALNMETMSMFDGRDGTDPQPCQPSLEHRRDQSLSAKVVTSPESRPATSVPPSLSGAKARSSSNHPLTTLKTEVVSHVSGRVGSCRGSASSARPLSSLSSSKLPPVVVEKHVPVSE